MYTDLHTIWVSPALLVETRSLLLSPAKHGFEGFVLWAGARTAPGEFTISRAIFPVQRPSRTPFGLMVEVPGEELDRLNRECYRRREALIAQVHTHPGEAYHSELDDAKPLVASEGCISIVVPDFAREELKNLMHAAVYRLQQGEWRELTAQAVPALIRRTS
jgi:hypothetical protein